MKALDNIMYSTFVQQGDLQDMLVEFINVIRYNKAVFVQKYYKKNF